MKIPTESYEAIYDSYMAAISWLNDIGVKIGKGRTTHYERIIRHWKDAYKIATDEEAKKAFPDFVNSMFEIHDYIGIFESFGSFNKNDLKQLADKLQKSVNGPIRASDESQKSTSARNYLFEAVVAARAHRPNQGIEALLDTRSDTGISIHGGTVWIECKRVTTPEKIERNVRNACNQLERVLRRKVGTGNRGIVALDVSKILQVGDKILVQKNDEDLSKKIGQLTDSFIHEYSPLWHKVFAQKSRKIMGILLRTAYMASSEQRNLLVHVSDYGINPKLDISEADRSLMKSIAEALKSK